MCSHNLLSPTAVHNLLQLNQKIKVGNCRALGFLDQHQSEALSKHCSGQCIKAIFHIFHFIYNLYCFTLLLLFSRSKSITHPV